MAVRVISDVLMAASSLTLEAAVLFCCRVPASLQPRDASRLGWFMVMNLKLAAHAA